MDSTAETQVRDFILRNFLFGNAAKMPDDTESLLGSGIVDSTGVLELVDFLEGDLGVTVEASETVPANLDSIANITRFVAEKQAAHAS